MSDRNIFPGIFKDHPQTVNVVEKRAPTDDSVRLLREMEQKAREAVIAAISLNSNGFKGTILIETRPWECADVATILYEFNGKKERCEVRLDGHLNLQERIDHLVKVLADD